MKGVICVAVQKLKFMFEYGGICLWDNNGVVENDEIPISDSLKQELDDICEEFENVVNWSDPHLPSPWTRKECADFFDRAEIVLQKLKAELEGKYEIISCLDEDRQIYLHNNTFIDD